MVKLLINLNIKSSIFYMLLLFQIIGISKLNAQNLNDINALIDSVTQYKSGELILTEKMKYISQTDTVKSTQDILYYNTTDSSSNYLFYYKKDTFVFIKDNYIYSDSKYNRIISKADIIADRTKLFNFTFYFTQNGVLKDIVNNRSTKIVVINSYTKDEQEFKIYKVFIKDYKEFINSYYILHFNLTKHSLDKVIYRVEFMNDFQYSEVDIEIKKQFKDIDSNIYKKINTEYEHLNKRVNVITYKGERNDTIEFAPNWNLPLINGEYLNSKNIDSKLLLIDFWYVGCYPCLKAIPALVELDSIYNNKDLRIIGINAKDKEIERINKIINYHNIKYDIVLQGDSISKDFKVYGFPKLFLIDTKTNKVLHIEKGYSKAIKDNLIKEINKALKEDDN